MATKEKKIVLGKYYVGWRDVGFLSGGPSQMGWCVLTRIKGGRENQEMVVKFCGSMDLAEEESRKHNLLRREVCQTNRDT